VNQSVQKYTLIGLIAWGIAVVVRLTVVSIKCISGDVTPMDAALALEAALPLMAIGGSLALLIAPNAIRRVVKDVKTNGTAPSP